MSKSPPNIQNKEIYTVSNNDGYLTLKEGNNINWFKGNALTLTGTYSPIGYNISLPPKTIAINNILVTVYGGRKANEREKKAYNPLAFDFVGNYLLQRGTVIITLNLPDLLKLQVYQLEMPKHLHQEIHDCIHHFYHTLRNTPEKLHSLLKPLRNIKNISDGIEFWWGNSFSPC